MRNRRLLGGLCLSLDCHDNILYSGQLKQQAFISLSSGGWKSKFKVVADSVSGESPLPSFHGSIYLLCLHMVERVSSGLSSSYKDINPILRAPLL